MTPRLLMAKESVVMGMAIWHSSRKKRAWRKPRLRPRCGAVPCVLFLVTSCPLKRRLQAHEDIIARGGKPGKMLPAH